MLWLVIGLGCGSGKTELGCLPRYADEDGDGFGGAATDLCDPSRTAEAPGDCDDRAAATFPGAAELCDGVDNDCDGDTDEGLGSSWYQDADGDGYGVFRDAVVSCVQPPGHVANNDDCDDDNAARNPSAEELCDGEDNNCNGERDEGFTRTGFFPDEDGDGYGSDEGSVLACVAPDGYVEAAGDCDDDSAGRSPGIPEDCGDALDNDCDLLVSCADEDCAAASVCVEDCADGVDNDVDGRVDCEDGDCAGEAQCVEDCGDRRDNDADGLVDCEDDDCWWEEGCEHPAGVEVVISGGPVMALSLQESGFSDSSGRWRDGGVYTVQASSVGGLVRVLPEGAERWSTATSWTTCRWGVDSVQGTMDWYDGNGGESRGCGAHRSGFWVETGCRLSSSWFLPEGLKPRGPDVSACTQTFSGTWETNTFGRWYTGSVRSSGQVSSSWLTVSGYRSYWRTHTWMAVSIETATHMVYHR